ncbi:MAG: hypothetical protein ACT4N1_00895 [Nitrososphaerota archaeon]
MSQMHKVQCIGCGSREAIIISEKKYDGLRSSCPTCGANWPES